MAKKEAGPRLLTGGNPQIPKGYGDEPVQAFIAAMPDWKSDVGRRIDALVVAAVPRVQKAVKWNTPLYGTGQDHWFMGFNVTARYVKVTFFRGAQLTPEPPVGSKMPDVRYLHVFEDDDLDEKQLTKWIKAAAKLPGEKM